MMNILPNFSLWEERDKIKVLSSLSGLLIALSWFFVIYEGFNQPILSLSIPPQFYLLGVASTFATFIIMFLDIGN